MNSVWFRELGFFNNPFSIKPAIYSDRIVGYEEVVDEIAFSVLNKKMLFLEGEYGEGKSTILKRLINDFGGQKQVIYYSCNRMEARLNVKKLLNGRYGFWGKLFDMKPKDMILLLDEAQELGAKDYSKLYSYYQEGYLKSIVFVGKEFKKEEIDDNLKKVSKEVKLRKLTDAEIVTLVRRRVGSLPLLTDDVIKTVYNNSDKNVRKMLKNCESLCKHAVNFGETKISEDMIKEVLGLKVEKKVEKKPVVKKVEKKVEKKLEKKVVKKKEVKKKLKKDQNELKEEEKQVYKPDAPLNIGNSAEQMLDKGTEELLDDDQYY
ncbi:hypothetical protein HOD38_05965 [archaeon]|jgi:hypothetical protein|nr:hypothetical protein [archaeon]MBT4397784.1 hypothetical protein [archaeon]